MTHAALTPLLGPAFDLFLFAKIGDECDGPLLSVVSALARLDVDPWQEAACLAHMPREQAKQRLTSLLASLPNDGTCGLAPEIIAARLIALLPQEGTVNTAAPATLRPVAPIPHWRVFVGLGLLALLLVGYFIFFSARASTAPESAPGVPAAPSEPPPRAVSVDAHSDSTLWTGRMTKSASLPQLVPTPKSLVPDAWTTVMPDGME